LAFAGLYATWAGPNGEEIDTVCIVTTEPNREVSAVYDRMPAILSGDDIDTWLNCRDFEARDALRLIAPAPEGMMTLHPVPRTVGKADADGPELIVPAVEEEAPPLRPKKRAAGGDQLDLF
jgi:putative SOS response-associated peptidase YedK